MWLTEKEEIGFAAFCHTETWRLVTWYETYGLYATCGIATPGSPKDDKLDALRYLEDKYPEGEIS
jgi:hypothetical protein